MQCIRPYKVDLRLTTLSTNPVPRYVRGSQVTGSDSSAANPSYQEGQGIALLGALDLPSAAGYVAYTGDAGQTDVAKGTPVAKVGV